MSSQKEKNHICLEVSELFPLAKYDAEIVVELKKEFVASVFDCLD